MCFGASYTFIKVTGKPLQILLLINLWRDTLTWETHYRFQILTE